MQKTPGAGFADIVRLALSSLFRNRIRTLLTMLGVIVGTAGITLMLAVGWSGYSQLQDQIEKMSSLTLIEVYSGDALRDGLTASNIVMFSELAHVEAASAVVDLPAEITAGPYGAAASLRGVDPAVLRIDLEEGRMYAADSQNAALVIGPDALRMFTDPLNPPDFSSREAYENYRPAVSWQDTSVRLQVGYPDSEPPGREYRAEVVGVAAASDPYTSDQFIYLSVPAARKLISENRQLAEVLGISEDSFDLAFVRVDSIEHTEEVMDELSSIGFAVSSDITYVRSLRQEQSRQLLQLLLTGVISLIVAAIGIANTMYATVLEQRKAIGIMKVLGMRSREIRALFLLESLGIGVAGGLIGLGVSYVLVWLLNAGIGQGFLLGMQSGADTWLSIPPPAALIALLTSSLTAVIAGLYPAQQATALSPREAMLGQR